MRELVAAVTGVSSMSVVRIRKLFREGGESALETRGTLPSDKKHQLLARIPAEYHQPRFFSQDIAEACDHKVIFTPPYHPELEPIETIWAVIKNRIAAKPARTMTELGTKIVESCGLVTSKTWLGARKRAMRKEDEYWASVDSDLVADDNGNLSLDDVAETDVMVADTEDAILE
jgi:hypothetical protein